MYDILYMIYDYAYQDDTLMTKHWHWLSPLIGRRVIDIFDDDGNGEVDFKEFIMGLSHFRSLSFSSASYKAS